MSGGPTALPRSIDLSVFVSAREPEVSVRRFHLGSPAAVSPPTVDTTQRRKGAPTVSNDS